MLQKSRTGAAEVLSMNYDRAKQRVAVSRLNPEIFQRKIAAEQPKPRGTDRLVEYTLFGVFGTLIVLACLALYASYAPSFKKVPNTVEAGMQADRINILFVGVGGVTHPGGGKDLADAIILASFKPSTKQIAVVSLPRDLYVKVKRYGKHRLNMAHRIGSQTTYPGGGAALLMDTVTDTVNQPVHAYVRVDFAAFKKIVDDLGGIDIHVQRPFYDYLFKDGFKAGWQHMNGDRALRYVRYRYVSASAEGNIFARDMRQQQVLEAIRAKLAQRNPGNMVRIAQTVQTMSKYTDTNLTTPQMVWFYRSFHDVPPEKIRHVSLKPFLEDFQLNTIADAGEAVRPKSDDFTEIRTVLATIFEGRGQISAPDEIKIVPVASAPAASPEAPPGK